jgi:hypothetical protein
MYEVYLATQFEAAHRLVGAGLLGEGLLGAAGCGGRLGGRKKVVKFLTGAEETNIQERVARRFARKLPQKERGAEESRTPDSQW